MEPFSLDDLEILTVGRSSIDLYPEQTDVPLSDVTSFRKAIGGSPTNVAVAAARLGHRAAIVTKVGDDAFGAAIRDGLRIFGVHDAFVSTHPSLLSPVVFCELLPPEDPTLWFYRQPRGPEMDLTIADLPLPTIVDVPLFWVTGTSFSAEPSRSATMKALEARRRAGHTVLDLDYRRAFWSSMSEASRHIGAALRHVTVAVGNREECEMAVGSSDPDTAADLLLGSGVKIAVVKLGGDGVMVATAESRATVPPMSVDVVCGLGAGDAFGGSLCHGLLEGWDPIRTVRYANAAGAIVAGRLMCSDAMPTLDEIEEMMS